MRARSPTHPRHQGDFGDFGDIFLKSLKTLAFLHDPAGDIFGDFLVAGDLFPKTAFFEPRKKSPLTASPCACYSLRAAIDG